MTETAGESTPWDCDVLLPDEILRESPSAKDGVAAEVELAHRVWGAELAQEAAILLRLPQVVTCTAQNLFHRFLYRKSLRRFDAFAVAMGALFLAAKIEERPKRLRLCLVRHGASRRNTSGPARFTGSSSSPSPALPHPTTQTTPHPTPPTTPPYLAEA